MWRGRPQGPFSQPFLPFSAPLILGRRCCPRCCPGFIVGNVRHFPVCRASRACFFAFRPPCVPSSPATRSEFARNTSRVCPRHVASVPATRRAPMPFPRPSPALYILHKCVSPSRFLPVPLRAFPVTPCFPAPAQKSSLPHEKNPRFCLPFRAKGVPLHPLSARAPRRFGPAAFSRKKVPRMFGGKREKALPLHPLSPFSGGEEVL